MRLALVLTLTGWAQAQNALPGKPEDNGVIPLGDTIYVNTLDTINNSKTESLGVGIARNGNVLVGWEDDGSDLTDLEAVWTLFTREGTQLTPDTEITSLNPSYAGQKLTSKFLSYFRSNGTAISGRTSWGPKIKANLFGDGIGMGATSFELGIELTQFADIQMDAGGGGDFPSVQLLDGVGPATAAAVADWFAQPGNRQLLRKLRAADCWPVQAARAQPASGPLSGKTLVITGTLPGLSREAAAELITGAGGKVSGSVSKKTSYLLAGENAGSKLTRAQELGVAVIDVLALKDIIGE